MPPRHTRKPYTPQLTRSTHPNHVARPEGDIRAEAPMTRREARMLEALRNQKDALTRDVPIPAPERQVVAPVLPAGTVLPAAAVAPTELPVAFSRRELRERQEQERRAAERTPGRTHPHRHLVLAVSGGLVVAAIAAGASLSFGSTPATETAAADASTSASVATALPVKSARSVVLTGVSSTSGTVAGGTNVTLTGSGLDAIASVSFGGVQGTVSSAIAGEAVITVPAAPDSTAKTVDVAFYDATGAQITFDAVTDAAASAATAAGSSSTEAATEPAVDEEDTVVASAGTTPLATDATDATAPDDAATSDAAATDASTSDATTTDATTTDAAATDTTATPVPTESATDTASATPTPTASGPTVETKLVATALAFAYTPDPAIEAAKVAAALRSAQIEAQLAYVDEHVTDYNTAEYGVISGNDCVNFASQSLVARGWTMDSEWSYSKSGGYSTAWASSTAFAGYLASHPERATAVSYADRATLEPGDIVQFDWDASGDWDHTGIVTRVETTEDGVVVHYSSHTADTDDKSIEITLANQPGTRISFWAIA